MSTSVSVTVELRLNNSIFRCVLCEKYHNLKHTKAYALTNVNGVAANANGQISVVATSLVVCETCYKENSEDKGLQLVDPSNIIVPDPVIPSGILKQN